MKKKSNSELHLFKNKELKEIKSKLIAERKNFRTHFITALTNLEINKLDKETQLLRELVAA